MKRNSREILDAIARKYVPDDINLFPRISGKIQNRNASVRLRPRIIIAISLILVVFIALMATMPDIVMAMHRLLGFIPGRGIVDQDSSLRVLAEPVTKYMSGISITVDEAVLSTDKTVIMFNVEGIGWEMLSHDESIPGCIKNPEIHLPDGMELELLSGSSEGQRNRFVFSAIPAGIDEASFILPCIANTLPGKAPENWVLLLSFVPAPSDMTILPVIEISPSPQTAEAAVVSQTLLTLDKVVELKDGYILIGSIHSIVLPDGKRIDAGMQVVSLRFFDANGNDVNAEYASEIDFPEQTMDFSPWAYKINGKYIDWPVKITLDTAVASFSGQAVKEEFDAGADPKDGQIWKLNKDFEIEGYKIHLASIQRLGTSYKFKLQQVDSRVANVGVWFEDFTPTGGGGGGDNQGNFDQSLIFEDTIPTGKLTMVISILTVNVPGSWSVTWQPEELPTPPPNITPTLNSSLCLTKDTLSQLAPLPTQMIGKILMYEQMENGEEWGITLSDLDGNQRQVIADSGSWAAISTDGNRVVYSMQDGLAVVDLLSGQVKSLGIDGYNPRWSPDGRQIAFISGEVPDVFVISADGTNLERVTNEANGTNAVAGWSSDGMRLYITRLGVDGHILRAVDMPNRSITDLFMLANSSIKAPFATISPDGEWVAYRDTHLSSLYLARMDGSEFRLLIQNPGSGISGAVWSGDWLAVTLRMVDYNEHILLRPDTCQAFLLNLSEGEIQGLFLP